jgi:hypothetical protein
LLWPIAFIWAFTKTVGAPRLTPVESTTTADPHTELRALQARIDSLTATVNELQGRREGRS